MQKWGTQITFYESQIKRFLLDPEPESIWREVVVSYEWNEWNFNSLKQRKSDIGNNISASVEILLW